MKKQIIDMIHNFVKEYEKKNDISTKWGEPLVGFADANDPYILNLKELITPTHNLPTDVLSSPSIVIAYFVPFTKELARTNEILEILLLLNGHWLMKKPMQCLLS